MFNTAAQYFLPKNVPNKVLHVTSLALSALES